MQGRLPVHKGTNPQSDTSYRLAQRGGVETVALTANQFPLHTHAAMGNKSPGNQSKPNGGVWAAVFDDPSDAPEKQYVTSITGITIGDMRADAIVPAGVDKPMPHDNVMPYLTVSFIICLMGIYPTRD